MPLATRIAKELDKYFAPNSIIDIHLEIQDINFDDNVWWVLTGNIKYVKGKFNPNNTDYDLFFPGIKINGRGADLNIYPLNKNNHNSLNIGCEIDFSYANKQKFKKNQKRLPASKF